MFLKLEGKAKCHYNGKTYQRGAVIMEFLPGAIKFLKRVGWVEYNPDLVKPPDPEPESDEVEFPRPEHPLRPTVRDPLEPEPEPVPPRKRGRPRIH